METAFTVNMLLVVLVINLSTDLCTVKASVLNSHVVHFYQAQDTLDSDWLIFKKTYNKEYSTSEEEEKRRQIFHENLNRINAHNIEASVKLESFQLGVNKYADLEPSEFARTMNGLRGREIKKDGATYLSPNIPLNLPSQIDWRTNGYVTGVKDQGGCGSCWAFSSTGSLEGQLKRKTGTLVPLSEQNLVDCSFVWGNDGCSGGYMDNSFEYIKDNYGIDTEAGYPYIGVAGTCHYNASLSGGRDTGYVDIEKGSESDLKEAVATIGPISVGIDASQSSFLFYRGGIYNEFACTQNIDHAVLVVGYGSIGTQDYWLVKNSWGTTWGDKGYIMMSRNARNQCGIASMASYPLV